MSEKNTKLSSNLEYTDSGEFRIGYSGKLRGSEEGMGMEASLSGVQEKP
jgi:hypothetical protein